MAYDDLFKGYREATRGLESQAASERERVTREYDTQRDSLQRQLSSTERDVQRTLGQLRTAERREQRRRDLPASKPRDLGTQANIESIRAEGERYRREIRDLQAKVEQARGESVRDLERQVKEAQAELDSWRRDAVREVRAAQKTARDTISTTQTATPTLGRIEAYKVNGGYDIARAMREGVTWKELTDAGFDRADISQASEVVSMSSMPTTKAEKQQQKAISDLGAVMDKINAKETAKQAFTGAEAKAGVGPKIDTKAATRERIASNIMVGPTSYAPFGQAQDLLSKGYGMLEAAVGRGKQDRTKAEKALATAGGLAGGVALSVLAPVSMLDTFLASPKPSTAKKIATGIKDYFVSLPVAFSNDPYFTTGEVAGMLAGVKGVRSAARSARVWADPYGVPARTVGIEFSVSKIPTKGMGTPAAMADLGKAVAKAQSEILKGKLSGTATVGNVSIKYRGSPIQHTAGSMVMHATPDVAPLIKNPNLVVQGEGLYFSPQLSPRFMASSAAGTTAKNPGVIVVLTDASKVRTPPKGSLGKLAKAPGDNFIVHADQGLWSPSKLYKHAFENEIVASPGTKFTKTPSTLRSRLLGDKAGDFLVQYSGPDAPGITSGQLVPMHIFADKGVFRTPPTPAALYAAKLVTIYESLKDVGVKVRHPLSGNKTFKITGNAAADQTILAKALKDSATKAAKDKVPSGTGKAYDTAYRRALVTEYSKLARSMNDSVSAAAARSYAKDPSRFERAYSSNLTGNLNNMARAASTEQAYRDVRASSGRVRSIPESSLRDWQRAEKEAITRERASAPRDSRTATTAERTITEQTPAERPPTERPPTERPPTERPPAERPPAERPPDRRVPPSPIPTGNRLKLQLPDGESVSLTQQQYAGIVAWKQGLFYILVYPPYGKANTIYTRKPVAGIQYGSGPGSPQRTARVVGGKLPRAFELAMGVTKVKVRPGAIRGKPRLKFRAREVVEPEMGEMRRTTRRRK